MNIFASLKLINDMKNLSLGSLMRILSAFIFLLSNLLYINPKCFNALAIPSSSTEVVT